MDTSMPSRPGQLAQRQSAVGAAIQATPGDLPPPTWAFSRELSLTELDAAAPDLTRLQVQILANRNIVGADAARAFVRADWRARPPAPLGLDVAVARLRAARARGERVVVFGDYDVDGLTSCAVMLLALRRAGIDAHPYVPSREDDGRGLNMAAVRHLADGGARLVVTTDCGVSNIEEARLAADLGLEVIVTDHHPPQGDVAPAVAVVNPRQAGCPSPEKNLAGAGVAFRLAEAFLAAKDGPVSDETLASLLDLVAIGTIGDIVPLTSENWALAHTGLERLNAQPRPGLRALAERVGLQVGSLTERDISFALAPCLNAAGRMGDPLLALRLLLTDDTQEAGDLARQLQQLNEERQRATDRVLAEARAQALAQLAARESVWVIAVSGPDWPLGIIGLVAGRLSEEFGRPALAASVNGEECRGSIRTPDGFNLVETLAQRAELFRRFGGHSRAAGFTLAAADLPALVAHLQAAAELAAAQGTGAAPTSEHPAAGMIPVPSPHAANPHAVPGEDVPGAEVEPELAADPDLAQSMTEVAVADPTTPPGFRAHPSELLVDCRLPLRRLVPDTFRAIRALAPYGSGFPPPIFVAAGVHVLRCWRSGPAGRNLRLVLREGSVERTALWARQGERIAAVRELGAVDVAYTLDAFTRPGWPTVYQARVLALRPAESTHSAENAVDSVAQPPT
jgi:single-stranded-DNA-specific exonuclease